jgi:hypothetical protein
MAMSSEALRGTVESPVYTKVARNPAHTSATAMYMVVVDEGWRSSILCDSMYEWAADWLVEQLQGKPFAPGTAP